MQWPRPCREPGWNSEDFGPFEKAASRPLVVTQTDPPGGEETRAFGGSRGPNSVTRSLHSFSAVGAGQEAGVPHPFQSCSHCPPTLCPPSGCGERLREGASVRRERKPPPPPSLQGALIRGRALEGDACGWVFPPSPQRTGMKAAWPAFSPHQPHALKDSPREAGEATRALLEGWGHSSEQLWEVGEAWPLSPHTRCTVTHTPKPSQLDVRFAKPNASLMRSTLSPRGSWEGSSAPCRPGEGLQAQGMRGRPASPSALPLYPLPHPLPPQQGPQAFDFPPGGSFGSQMWSSGLASTREGSRGSETGKGLWKQTDVYTAVGLRHLHMSCAILGKFPDPSEPPPCQHPHAQGLPED